MAKIPGGQDYNHNHTSRAQHFPGYFGWSAGGFMTSWVITQTGRYRAAIEGAGITEWASFTWTSDVQQFDFDSDLPEKDIAQFQRFSPVMYADKVTTPVLILHGEKDLRRSHHHL